MGLTTGACQGAKWWERRAAAKGVRCRDTALAGPAFPINLPFFGFLQNKRIKGFGVTSTSTRTCQDEEWWERRAAAEREGAAAK